MTTDELDAMAGRLAPWQRRALLAPGVDGLAALSDRRADQMVALGLAAEYDVPTLGGYQNEPHVQEMRRFGIALVAQTWTKKGLALRARLEKHNGAG